MTWLVAHMWIALAGAAGIALLLGWSVRGMLLLGKLRRAEVDRDVTKVELGEARDEIERLFASQRKLLTGQGGTLPAEAMAVSPQADPELERRLSETLASLGEARAELEALRSAPPVLVPAPEPAALTAFDGGAGQQARELEERIVALEADLAEARQALSAAEIARAEAVAAATASDAPAAEPDAKLVWKVGYLTQRVTALEDALVAQPVLPSPVVVQAEEEAPAQTPVATLVETSPEADGDQDSVEEELARLRWRNRYLEGRIAYFEGDAASVAEEIAAEEEAGDAYDEDDLAEDPVAVDETFEEVSFGEDEASLPEDEADFDLDAELEALEAFDVELGEPVEEDIAEEEEDGAEQEEDADEAPFRSAAEAILGQLEEEDALADAAEGDADEVDDGQEEDEEPVDAEEHIVPARPLALERPVEGAPVDLTLIGGIGPRIQEVLNSLGIFHYDQIAEWTPQNIAWVDDYLNFNGRIKREGWVEQAAILVGESVEP